MMINQGQQRWLSLSEYASKYQISISTLRRRIKNESFPYKLVAGKYQLLDIPIQLENQPQRSTGFESSMAPSADELKSADLHEPRAPIHPQTFVQDHFASTGSQVSSGTVAGQTADEPLLSTASQLLLELKRAYMNVLQEKEEQIIFLKEEVADLRTLVRVLEDDNERLRRESQYLQGMLKVAEEAGQ